MTGPIRSVLLMVMLAMPVAARDSLPTGIGTDLLPLVGEGGTERQTEEETQPPDQRSQTESPGASGPPGADPVPAADGIDPHADRQVPDGESTAGEPTDEEPPQSQLPDPLQIPSGPQTPFAVLAGLWRQAVADGRTNASLEAWIASELGKERRRETATVPEDQTDRTRAAASE